ncbi:hypothetical protein A2U01_0067877 [Trifolium medium]|uniref:Uncharacterized protein n=1 Tax=Trifolium medium TaxID=97028 RepID=A0A392SFL5_9FABA|nr:hypothetical protein [Trifolium medium]
MSRLRSQSCGFSKNNVIVIRKRDIRGWRRRCGGVRHTGWNVNIRVRRMALGGNKKVIINNSWSRRCICVRQRMN